MDNYLYRSREVKFGNSTLITFLKAHGAEMSNEQITTLDVPVSALRQALAHPKEVGLTEQDVAIITKDLEQFDEDESVVYCL
jgi:hypothetical protein